MNACKAAKTAGALATARDGSLHNVGVHSWSSAASLLHSAALLVLVPGQPCVTRKPQHAVCLCVQVAALTHVSGNSERKSNLCQGQLQHSAQLLLVPLAECAWRPLMHLGVGAKVAELVSGSSCSLWGQDWEVPRSGCKRPVQQRSRTIFVLALASIAQLVLPWKVPKHPPG